MKSRNIDTLIDFYIYCLQHPEEGFWEALKNWSVKYKEEANKYLLQLLLD